MFKQKMPFTSTFKKLLRESSMLTQASRAKPQVSKTFDKVY